MRNGIQSVGERSSSTSFSSQQDTDDDGLIAQVLSEEYAKLDGAVGRCLSNLSYIPLAAKICLLTSFRDTCFIEIIPQYQAPKSDAPAQKKPRKKHWLL